MSKRSEELRKQARELTRTVNADDDRQAQDLSLGLAQACIALARNEEWLDGEVSPVEKSTREGAAPRTTAARPVAPAT
jgi:hypothetical protein